jgi:hypothetical protein
VNAPAVATARFCDERPMAAPDFAAALAVAFQASAAPAAAATAASVTVGS